MNIFSYVIKSYYTTVDKTEVCCEQSLNLRRRIYGGDLPAIRGPEAGLDLRRCQSSTAPPLFLTNKM